MSKGIEEVQSWVIRLACEYSALDDKTNLLAKTIAAEAHRKMGKHAELLEQQLVHMTAYRAVLWERVKLALTKEVDAVYYPEGGTRCSACCHAESSPVAQNCSCHVPCCTEEWKQHKIVANLLALIYH